MFFDAILLHFPLLQDHCDHCAVYTLSLAVVKGCDTTLSGGWFCKKAQIQGHVTSSYTGQSTVVYWTVILIACNRAVFQENLGKCKK